MSADAVRIAPLPSERLSPQHLVHVVDPLWRPVRTLPSGYSGLGRAAAALPLLPGRSTLATGGAGMRFHLHRSSGGSPSLRGRRPPLGDAGETGRRSGGGTSAGPVARALKAKVDPGAVRRVRHTPILADLSAAERQRLVAGLFECRREVTGASVAIVDDVVTSGATADSLAASLKAAGAGTIHLWSATAVRIGC